MASASSIINTDHKYKFAHRGFYYKNLSRALKQNEDRVAMVSHQQKWRQQQIRANYQNEYDRIQGLLSKTVMKDYRLTERQQKLKQLGIQAVSTLPQ